MLKRGVNTAQITVCNVTLSVASGGFGIISGAVVVDGEVWCCVIVVVVWEGEVWCGLRCVGEEWYFRCGSKSGVKILTDGKAWRGSGTAIACNVAAGCMLMECTRFSILVTHPRTGGCGGCIVVS